MAETHIYIEGTSLAKGFNGRMIFSGIGIRAAAGSPVAVTGPNGSGKSTLLEILAGLRKPTSGEVRRAPGGAEAIGFMSPRLTLYGELTALELLEFAAKSSGASARALPLLEGFGLSAHGHSRIGSFSTGMLQRLKFITAVINDPPLLFLDEPCSNLDAPGRDAIFKYLRSLQEKKAIVIATNDAAEADFCAGRVGLG